MGEEPVFWADKHVERILRSRDEDHFNINGGLSVSGPIHLGNMRADIIIPQVLAEILKENGKKATQICISYTQDPFKGKKGQLIWFEHPEAAKKMAGEHSFPENYTPKSKLQKKLEGRRLIDVPDPLGCHESWYHHFWDQFEEHLGEFGVKNLKVIPTSEFYSMKKTKEAIKKVIKNKKMIKNIITKYQKRKEFPEDWIPFVPWCPECKNISQNKALSVDLDAWEVEYKCNKCGKRGRSSMENGKLPWRIEWAVIWHVLDIDVEPYGKDHVVEGGSRDAAKEIQERLFGTRSPYGFFCEWIGKKWQSKDLGDMTGGGNIAWVPEQWLEIASPEAFRYFYIGHKHTKRFAIDFKNIDKYVRGYDKAERIYSGEEEAENERRKKHITRSYKLSQTGPVPKEVPTKIPYQYAAILGQTVVKPEEEWDKVRYLLKRTGHLKEKISQEDKENIIKRLRRAKNWAYNYAPEKIRFKILEEFPKEIVQELSEKQKSALGDIGKLLEEEHDLDKLESELFEIAKDHDLSFGKFFQAAYKVLIGKKSGPRLAPLLLSIEDFATERFNKI